MKQLLHRSKLGLSMFWWGFNNPKTMQIGNFRMLSDLLGLILKVATENNHRMTHIACVHPDEEEKQIVSIWAGAGLGADPTKRIEELLRENSQLKLIISEKINKK